MDTGPVRHCRRFGNDGDTTAAAFARHPDGMPENVTGADGEIDWGRLAVSFDAVEFVSGRKGQLALAEVIGDDRLRASVDWYIAGRPGSELARFALWQIRPTAARDRCLEIWRSDGDPTRRQLAVELLRVVATAEDLELIEEFLGDDDPLVQVWGIGVLDQLVWSHQVEPEDAEPLLVLGATHSNADVRERCEFIREVIQGRGTEEG